MRKIILGSFAVLYATAALAADPLAVYYGNTVVITDDKGEMGRTLINPDHSFVSYQPDGTPVRGVWQTDGTQICYTATSPAPPQGQQAPRVCRPLVPHNVGDSWNITQDGKTWTATLKAGR
jgi:hypothetical protein